MTTTGYSVQLRHSQSPVVFFSNGIGDGVLALPALRALCLGFDGRPSFVLRKGPDKFLFDRLTANRLLFLDMWQRSAELAPEFATEVASDLLEGCDLFLSFVEWQSASLSKLKSEAMAPTSAGFFQNYNLWLPADREKHQFDAMFAISARIFPELHIEQFSYPLEFSPGVQGAGEEILSSFAQQTLIGFHPESSLATKSCSSPLVEDVVRSILDLGDKVVVCVFGRNASYSALEAVSNRVLVFNCVPLQLAAYLVSRMTVFVGVDSCFLHVADICRVPGVGLFGPTSYRKFGFRFSPHVHIQQSNMGQITGAEVATVLKSLLPR